MFLHYPVTMAGSGDDVLRNIATFIPANTLGFVLQWFIWIEVSTLLRCVSICPAYSNTKSSTPQDTLNKK